MTFTEIIFGAIVLIVVGIAFLILTTLLSEVKEGDITEKISDSPAGSATIDETIKETL